MTKAATRAKARYNAKAYDEIKLHVYKGQKEEIRKFATRQGKSLNQFIADAIEAEMKKDPGD